MILENKSNAVETIGEIKENEVSIDPRNISHIITILSSNLYSNPEESFLRETISNAWDSHVEAGNTNEPVVLSILEDKNNWNYGTIAIRDFGTGISPERFNDIYLNIGSSTKRDSNKYIGAFGIGRFSALSCSNVVTITSYYNGMCYKYIMLKNVDKINIDQVSATPTKEKNGVEVRIDNVQINKYQNGLNAMVFMPNLYVNSEVYWAKQYNQRKIVKYKTFNWHDRASSDVNILLGNVIYPIDINTVKIVSSGFGVRNLDILSKVYPRFNIGDLDVTPNRENLLYSTKTINKLKEVYAETIKELQEMYYNQNKSDYSNFFDFFDRLTDSTRYIQLGEGESVNNIYCNDSFLDTKKEIITYNGIQVSTEIKNWLMVVMNKPILDYLYLWRNGRDFSSKSKSIHPKLRDFCNRYYNSINRTIVLPSLANTKSKYFRDWVTDHYKSTIIKNGRTQYANYLIWPTQFHSLKSLKDYLKREMLLAPTNQLFQQNYPGVTERELLWWCNQIKKAVNNISTYVDIVNDPNYIAFKKAKTKEVREANTKFGKSITVYIGNHGYFSDRTFSDVDSVMEYITKRHGKKITIYKACRDDVRAQLLPRVYFENNGLVLICVAKTNIKHLDKFPESVKPIEEFMNEHNHSYVRHLQKRYNVMLHEQEIRGIIKQNDYNRLSSLARFLPENKRKKISQVLESPIVYDSDKEMYTTAISLLPECLFKDTMSDAILECIELANNVSVLEPISKLTTSNSAVLQAYFGMKAKLFRVNKECYNKHFKNIHNILKIKQQ